MQCKKCRKSLSSRKAKYCSAACRQADYRKRLDIAKRNTKALQITDFQDKITRPVLRYSGGKYKIGQWIIDEFPEHYTYVEPFCGGASVFFKKTPSPIEVINDLNDDIINFFDVLRSRRDELVQAIQFTPFARSEQKRAFEQLRSTTDSLERARLVYVLAWQSFGTGFSSANSGWRYERTDSRGTSIVRGDWNDIDRLFLAAERLKMAQIECDDALRVIERYDSPDTLFYIDPPYLADTRTSKWASKMYKHEMDDDQHIELAHILNNLQGMVILSGYDSQLYKQLYAGWRHKTRGVTTNGKGQRVESIWLSPNAINAKFPMFK